MAITFLFQIAQQISRKVTLDPGFYNYDNTKYGFGAVYCMSDGTIEKLSQSSNPCNSADHHK